MKKQKTVKMKAWCIVENGKLRIDVIFKTRNGALEFGETRKSIKPCTITHGS